MRRLLLIAALPLLAAADMPDADWHRCNSDQDCVLVPGICGQSAVNAAFTREATDYYARQPKKACGSVFWKPPANAVRCHLQSCEAIARKE
jgi:hypothetical protein